MSGIIPLLLLRAFVAWKGKVLPSADNPGAFAGWRGKKPRNLAVTFPVSVDIPLNCGSNLVLQCFCFLNGGVGKRAVCVLCKFIRIFSFQSVFIVKFISLI
jgi:hypothetical protein